MYAARKLDRVRQERIRGAISSKPFGTPYREPYRCARIFTSVERRRGGSKRILSSHRPDLPRRTISVTSHTRRLCVYFTLPLRTFGPCGHSHSRGHQRGVTALMPSFWYSYSSPAALQLPPAPSRASSSLQLALVVMIHHA